MVSRHFQAIYSGTTFNVKNIAVFGSTNHAHHTFHAELLAWMTNGESHSQNVATCREQLLLNYLWG